MVQIARKIPEAADAERKSFALAAPCFFFLCSIPCDNQ